MMPHAADSNAPWRPAPPPYNFERHGDDADLADDAETTVVDVTAVLGRVATHSDAATHERVVTHESGASWLWGIVRNAPTGARHLRQRVASWAALPTHPDAWKLNALRDNYAANPRLYEQIEATQRAELAPRLAQAERRQTVLTWAKAAAAVLGPTLALVLFLKAPAVLVACVAASCVALPIALGLVGQRVALAATQPAERVDDAPTHDAPRVADAPPPRVELTRETVTTALRNAGVIEATHEIVVTPARPMQSAGEPNGWLVRVTLPAAVKGGAKRALAARENIAFALDREPNCVLMEPVAGRGLVFEMWVAERDPMAMAATMSPLVHATRTNIHKPVQVGVSVLNERVHLRMTDQVHGLITGDTGGGKSSLAAVLVANEALYPWGYPIIIDPQRSARWRPYGEVGTVIGGTDPEEMRRAAQVMAWLAGPEMDRRGRVFEEYLRAHPLAATEDKLTPEMMELAALGMFHLLIVVDEMHTVLSCSVPFDPADESARPLTCGKVINDSAQQIVTRARRIGMNLAGITQRGSTTNIPGDIRSILQGRAMFACNDDETADMGLGPGWKAAGMDPRALSTETNKGACYVRGEWLVTPRRPWVLLKTDHIDVAGHRQIATRARELKEKFAPHVLAWQPEPLRRGPARTAPPAAVVRPPAQLLEQLRAVLEDEGALHAPAIVARLAAEDPDAYLRTPATRQGLDALLAPLGIRCERFQRAGVRDHGLKYSSLPSALPEACQGPATGSGLAGGGQA